MDKPIWCYAVHYSTRNGITQYASSFKNKSDLVATIREHRKNEDEKNRPLTPVEPWVFDSVRDWLVKGERIKKLRVFIRDIKNGGKKGGYNTTGINAGDI